MVDVTVVVPAYEEAARIGPVLEALVREYDVVVVDDGSTDETAAIARAAGARVVEHATNEGYVASLKDGFRAATGDIVVTFDADGEHRPSDVARLVAPIRAGELDLVFGARASIPRPSERVLNRLARRRVDVSDTGTGLRALRRSLAVDVSDTGTGLRALRRSLAVDLELDAACTCGTFALEAVSKGARVGEVRIETRPVRKPRGVAWQHGRQFFHVLRYVLTI